MFPFNFEWIWDAGHMVFMGGLWYALSILGPLVEESFGWKKFLFI
jgi:hypothetical protein